VVDGYVARGCLLFAVQLEGCTVETIEGATQSGRVADLQAAFVKRNALQCGFCTPGMILTAAEAIAQNTCMSRDQIREAMSGNLCRCTGYEAIVDAVEACLEGGARDS
jgi:carbon-monoxide dehydrogenase small subunit